MNRIYHLRRIMYFLLDSILSVLLFTLPIVILVSLMYVRFSQITYNHVLYIELYEDETWVKYENVESVENNVVYYDDGKIVKYPDDELKVYYEKKCYIESKICPIQGEMIK